MDLGIFFWVLIIIWAFGYSWYNWTNPAIMGIGSLQLILIILLGLKVFPLHV